MAVFSCFALKNIQKFCVPRSTIGLYNVSLKSKVWNDVPVRNCHERTLVIRNSRFLYKKFKDMFHFYFMIGALPLAAVIFYVNAFIGPAKLALIPEGYEPKPWEYHEHPISRFFAKYIVRNPHERHERNMHNIFIQHEKFELKKLKNKIKDLIKVRQDYQAWYFDKPVVKYVRKQREETAGVGAEKNVINNWVK